MFKTSTFKLAKRVYIYRFVKIIMVLIVLLVSNYTFSQDDFRFKQIDSLIINLDQFDSDELILSGHGIKIYNDFLFIYPLNADFFFKYDLANNQFKRITLSSVKNKDDSKIHNLIVDEDLISIINPSRTTISQYSWDGTLLNSMKIKLFDSKFKIGDDAINNFEYNVNLDVFYLPVTYNFKRSYSTKNKVKKVKEYYKREGLIGVFNKQGRLIKTLGKYDSLYFEGTHNYADDYAFSLTPKNELVLSQQLSSVVSVYNDIFLNTNNLHLKGKRITKSKDELPIAHKYLPNEEYYSALINSYSYYKSHQINDSILMRGYVCSSVDTTTSNPIAPFEIKENKSRKFIGCKAPSEREVNQIKIIRERALFSQIFNLYTGEVYYDGLSPLKGNIFSQITTTETNMFWTVILNNDHIKLYKYVFL